jgi:ubiquinone/menaquinone biosynthesis C-methylase UbiE
LEQVALASAGSFRSVLVAGCRQAGVSEIANVDQAASWDGPEGSHWSTHADDYDTSLREHLVLLQHAADISSHESVLDVGCGNGTSTIDAARAASNGRALGVDLSSEMLAQARQAASAAGVTNVEFLQADAQVHRFAASTFDVAMSRFGVMFFADPAAAFANIARALKPGGRIAWIVWRPLLENEFFSAVRQAIAVGRELPIPPSGAPSPFGLADPAYTEHTLREAGFVAIEIVPRDARYYAGRDADSAYDFVRGSGFVRFATQDLDDADRTRAFDALRTMVNDHTTSEGVVFGSACWLVAATRPPGPAP